MYDLISYTIFDTSKTKESDIGEMMRILESDFKADVYYSASWLKVERRSGEKSTTSLYDRSTGILYMYSDSPDGHVLRVDSLWFFKEKDTELLADIEKARKFLLVEDHDKEKRMIHGWKASAMTAGSYLDPSDLDTIWKTAFADVPNMLYPEHQYFLNKGLPLEISKEFEGARFTWGVVSVKPLDSDDGPFQRPEGVYKLEPFDSAELIRELAVELSSYDPSQPGVTAAILNFYLAYRLN